MGQGVRLRKSTRVAAAVFASLSVAVVIPLGFILDGSERWLAIVSGAACALVMTYAAIAALSQTTLRP